MTVTELRDELNKLIEAGLGNRPVQIWDSPDIDGRFEETSHVALGRAGEVMIV